MTKVGVMINGHEYVDYIGDALASVSMQTSAPDATIVVLDRPYEECLEVYRRLVSSYRHEVIVLNPEHGGGISFSRNAGFYYLAQQGMDFVIPLDEDDIMNPSCIARTRQAIGLDPEISVHYWDWAEFGNRVSYNRCPEWTEKELYSHPFIISSSAISVKMWQDIHDANGSGYDSLLTELGLRWEDYLFYLEGALLGHKMARIGVGALTKVRRHGRTGTDIANETVPEWRVYAEEKLETFYDRTDIFREAPVPES